MTNTSLSRRGSNAMLRVVLTERIRSGAPRLRRLLPSSAAAVCVVPSHASGPVVVSRFGMRSNPLAFGGYDGDDPTRVLRVDPADGLTGVFRDTPVLARLSRPAEPMSLSARTFRVEDAAGPVPGRARLSPDGRVVIWRGDRLLDPAIEHLVVLAGLRDERGREVLAHLSRFVPSTLTWAELAG
jgi:hypothetical protein